MAADVTPNEGLPDCVQSAAIVTEPCAQGDTPTVEKIRHGEDFDVKHDVAKEEDTRDVTKDAHESEKGDEEPVSVSTSESNEDEENSRSVASEAKTNTESNLEAVSLDDDTDNEEESPDKPCSIFDCEISSRDQLKDEYEKLQKASQDREDELNRLQTQYDDKITAHQKEMNVLRQELTAATKYRPDLERCQRDLDQVKQKLQAHDSAAKKAIAGLQSELKVKVEAAQKQVDEAEKEKQDMVMKYAMAEGKNIEERQKAEKADQRLREMHKEKEMIITKFKNQKGENQKMKEYIEAKNVEMINVRRDLDKCRDALQHHEGKHKFFAQESRQKQEQIKEMKSKNEELHRQVKLSKEETEQIRRDTQEIIKTYQESEDIKSNQLDAQLKEKESELILQRYEKDDQDEVQQSLKTELEILKKKHHDTVAALNTYKDKVRCLEEERRTQDENLEKFKVTLQNQKRENKDLFDRLCRLENVEEDLTLEKLECERLRGETAILNEQNRELRGDMEDCSKRESEHLIFTQKISDKNAKLQAENTSLSRAGAAATEELRGLRASHDEVAEKAQELERALAEERRSNEAEKARLETALADRGRAVESLTRELDDERGEIRTLKRRHQANTKDLTRQLNQAKKKLESQSERPAADGTSMGSRTSSSNSLDIAAAVTSSTANGVTTLPQLAPLGPPPLLLPSPQPDLMEEPTVQVVEVDKQVLIEKIVKLQRAAARKNEKLEFMQDHVQQLGEELRKKAKIIQNYALREESGALAPPSSDMNKPTLGRRDLKAQQSKRGGVMASVYSAHAQDGAMTLELSLDINRKLQAVLEDTLLKNITLKDNLETLGEEIARMSQENRKLHLSLHST